MKLSAVVVNYRAATRVAKLVELLRHEARELPGTLEIVLVDHSEEEAEVARLRAFSADRLLVGENRGYAAGVNRGVAAASGELLIVDNPDVEPQPGALRHLLEASTTYPIVGPLFLLGELLYPPTEGHLLRDEWARLLAHYSQAWQKRVFRRELDRCMATWSAAEPVPSVFLSGALMAFTRQAWQQLGPWDESYFLYYEETDWLLRAFRQALPAAQVPRARVAHAWGASANPGSSASYLMASRRRYLRKNFGPLGRLLARLPLRARAFPLRRVPRELMVKGQVLWLVSPTPLGVPAFGFFGDGAFPEQVLRRSFAFERHPSTFFVNAVSLASDQLLGPWRWDA
jgi:GT2 family glycosyltransferase